MLKPQNKYQKKKTPTHEIKEKFTNELNGCKQF